MYSKLRYLTALLLVVWGLAGAVSSSLAAPLFQIDQTLSPGTEPIDVVVVLDDSGSMATCWPWPEQGSPFAPPCRWPSENDPSDPEELRYSAARLLLHLADDADRVAVLRFDSTAEGIGALGSLQEAGSAERRRILAESVQPPADYTGRGYTRIDLGLDEAARLLAESRQPNRSQYVLLLTDGEPTAPSTASGQQARISARIDALQDQGVLIFPVVLCNPSSGCASEFLEEEFGPDLRKAQNAPDLLRVFSEIFAAMKADRSVVTSRNVAGNLAFQTRPEQGVGQLSFISPRAAISNIMRSETPVVAQSLLEDGNIDLKVVAGDVPPGEWIAQTSDPSTFAVVQADSYPALIFPPPSVPGSPASVRYYPEGQLPFIVARGAGPAAGEPLLLNGKTPIPSLGTPGLFGMTLPTAADEIMLQLGEDATPLQLQRSFRLAARSDLPRAEVMSPTPTNPGLTDDGRVRLVVGFPGGELLQNVQATVQVVDITRDDQLAYQAQMTCAGAICTDENFSPADGHSYRVLYLLTAAQSDVYFGAWDEGTLAMESAIYLRGLPESLDLAQMPAEGWPISILAGTSEDIGTLEGELSLFQADTGEAVSAVTLRLSETVDENNPVASVLRVEGLDQLRPGAYTGEIQLQALSPAGRPMDVSIRPAPVLPVSITVERSAARLGTQMVNFGELPFETSPNFRLAQEALIPVTFEKGQPFRLIASLAENNCEGLTVSSGELQSQGSGYALPVEITSSAPVPPGTCRGQIVLRGPNEDFDVFPAQVPYQLGVKNLAWTVIGDLDLGDLSRAGERATQTLMVRFDGKTPFTLRMADLAAQGETNTGLAELDESFLEMPPVEVRGEPDENGFYAVPITLIVNKAIPLDPLRGSFYSGDLALRIDGLPNESRTVDVTFRSPTLYQRYVAWWLVPIYSLPLLLCTGPLTLLLLLIVLARVRSSGYHEDEDEPVVTLPLPELSGAESTFVTPTFESLPSRKTANDSGWGESAWGGETTFSESPEKGTPPRRDTNTQEDAWSSKW